MDLRLYGASKASGPEAGADIFCGGAGRLFGRKEAKRRFSRAEMDAWLQSRVA